MQQDNDSMGNTALQGDHDQSMLLQKNECYGITLARRTQSGDGEYYMNEGMGPPVNTTATTILKPHSPSIASESGFAGATAIVNSDFDSHDLESSESKEPDYSYINV